MCITRWRDGTDNGCKERVPTFPNLNSYTCAGLQEMEFERGIWSAAMDGEEEKVRRLLGSGTSPDTTDSAGYTALVGADQRFILLPGSTG